jgi:hypothetical protein
MRLRWYSCCFSDESVSYITTCSQGAALGVPLVAIFAGSKPNLTGPVGSGPLAVLGAQGAAPSVEEVEEAVERIMKKDKT